MVDPRLKAYGLAALVAALDRLTKWIVESRVGFFDVYNVIPGFFDIVHSQNRGVAFGLFNDSTSEWRTLLLGSVSLAAVLALGALLWRPEKLDRPSLWGFALIMGGAAGNLYDRAVYGRVTDFLELYVGSYHWPTFNVADSAITIGSAMLVLSLLRPKRQTAGHSVYPEIFGIGFLHTYGVLVALAFLTALWLAGRLARQAGIDPEAVTNLGIYCALAAIVGAKLMMFAIDAPYYVKNPGEIFSLATLQAGGVFYGGLLLALAVAGSYMRKTKLPLLRTADVFAPGIALGHGIGRLGCFSAGCCWGRESHLPWAVTFTNPESQRLVGVPLNVPLHPTQLYEAAAEFAIFGILLWRFRKPHGKGSIISLYLVLYATARFLVEFLRFHEQANPFGGPLNTSQWISLALIAVGAAHFLKPRPRAV